jgi:predicted PurR-regulated permease PerM
MGVIIGPALYGFLLAVYRTVVIVRSNRPEEDEKRHIQDQSQTSGQE